MSDWFGSDGQKKPAGGKDVRRNPEDREIDPEFGIEPMPPARGVRRDLESGEADNDIKAWLDAEKRLNERDPSIFKRIHGEIDEVDDGDVERKIRTSED